MIMIIFIFYSVPIILTGVGGLISSFYLLFGKRFRNFSSDEIHQNQEEETVQEVSVEPRLPSTENLAIDANSDPENFIDFQCRQIDQQEGFNDARDIIFPSVWNNTIKTSKEFKQTGETYPSLKNFLKVRLLRPDQFSAEVLTGKNSIPEISTFFSEKRCQEFIANAEVSYYMFTNKFRSFDKNTRNSEMNQKFLLSLQNPEDDEIFDLTDLCIENYENSWMESFLFYDFKREYCEYLSNKKIPQSLMNFESNCQDYQHLSSTSVILLKSVQPKKFDRLYNTNIYIYSNLLGKCKFKSLVDVLQLNDPNVWTEIRAWMEMNPTEKESFVAQEQKLEELEAVAESTQIVGESSQLISENSHSSCHQVVSVSENVFSSSISSFRWYSGLVLGLIGGGFFLWGFLRQQISVSQSKNIMKNLVDEDGNFDLQKIEIQIEKNNKKIQQKNLLKVRPQKEDDE